MGILLSNFRFNLNAIQTLTSRFGDLRSELPRQTGLRIEEQNFKGIVESTVFVEVLKVAFKLYGVSITAYTVVVSF